MSRRTFDVIDICNYAAPRSLGDFSNVHRAQNNELSSSGSHFLPPRGRFLVLAAGGTVAVSLSEVLAALS
jgi:hypothetical protein